MKHFCFILLSLFLTIPSWAQENFFEQKLNLETYKEDLYKKNTQLGIAVGANMELGKKRNGAFRFFVSASFLHNMSSSDVPILIGGQTELDFFRGGLGTALVNEDRTSFQIELRNTIQVLSGLKGSWKNREYPKPAIFSVSNDRSGLYNPFGYFSAAIGTVFINGINHSRNQQIGLASASIGPVQANYSNDATPFNLLGLCDKFDRYWTGDGSLGLYLPLEFNVPIFEGRYDNYTGYQRNLYEVSSILELDNLSYKDKLQQMFNQARFQYRIIFNQQYAINFSVYEPKSTDVQNLIHYNISHSPFHARPLGRRMTLGADYIYRKIY